MITEAQRQNRSRGIFASDVARIMNGGSVSLVLEKLGELPPTDYDDVIEVEIGNLIEDKILDAYQAERPTLELERRPELLEFFHPEHDWLGCHPDSLTLDHSVNVEAKAIGDYNRGLWGQGGDEVPDKVLWQTLAQMACTGAPVTEVPVCFLNVAALKMLLTGRIPPIVIFSIPSDEELQEYMVERAKVVWDCIQNNVLPKPESLADVRLLYKKESGRVIEADLETFQHYQLLMQYHEQKTKSEKALEREKLQIQSFMEDASELRYNGNRLATWKNDRDSEKFDMDSFILKHPKLHKKFLLPKIGSRKFLPKEIK